MRELGAHGLSYRIDRAAPYNRIRAGEIDVLEDAGSRRHGWERLVRMHAGIVEYDDLAIFHVADVFGTDGIERAGFGGEDRLSVEIADHQGANPERIPGAGELLFGGAGESRS